MKKINEEFLHFLWKNQHLLGVSFLTRENVEIKVIDCGMHNQDAGPDFFNARIMIGSTLWAGNVELHINASDWLKHGHDKDPAYDNVILHVVYFDDCRVCRTDGAEIPTLILRFPSLLWDKYSLMMKEKRWIPCQEELKQIAPIHEAQWTSSLLIEKLQSRSNDFERQLEETTNHWDALLSRIIFRGFGVPVNTTPFEILSTAVPYQLLLRNKQSLFTLEAILFGQSSLLQTVLPQDIYTENLRKEFMRISPRIEYNRVPPESWKFMRLRPASFPTLRIAQLAALIHHTFPLHPFIERMPGKADLVEHLRIRASDYWNTHYQAGKQTRYQHKYLGDSFIQKLIVNAIVPYLFFFGRKNSQQQLKDYAIHLLECTPAEDNAILKKWSKFGKFCKNAFESQAYLYLYKNYCLKKQCLRCQYGNLVLSNGENTK